jgi:hypothetical protein
MKMSRHRAVAALDQPELRRGSRRSPVLRVPGARLRRLAQLCFSRTTFATVFEPILDELCAAYCQALAADDVVRARCVRWRGYCSFWWAVVEPHLSWIRKLFF